MCAQWRLGGPPFSEASPGAVRLQVGAVDHDRVIVPDRPSQVVEEPGKRPQPRPAHNAITNGLVRFVDRWCIPPAQTVAQDVGDPAQDPPVIHSGLATRLRKFGRSRSTCSSVSQICLLITPPKVGPQEPASWLNFQSRYRFSF